MSYFVFVTNLCIHKRNRYNNSQSQNLVMNRPILFLLVIISVAFVDAKIRHKHKIAHDKNIPLLRSLRKVCRDTADSKEIAQAISPTAKAGLLGMIGLKKNWYDTVRSGKNTAVDKKGGYDYILSSLDSSDFKDSIGKVLTAAKKAAKKSNLKGKEEKKIFTTKSASFWLVRYFCLDGKDAHGMPLAKQQLLIHSPHS